MQEFLRKQLHQNVEIVPYYGSSPLPLYLKNNYELSVIQFSEIECLLMRPLDKIHIATLKKHHAKLQTLTGLQCILCFKELRTYTYHKLVESGRPFIQEERHIYLPFLGMVLSTRALEKKELEAKEKVSFLTQQFLLLAIYRQWNKVSLTQVATEMNISKMSVSRCFDELESIALSCIKRSGRSRFFIWTQSWRNLWQVVSGFLNNPIVKQYKLQESLGRTDLMLAGVSALSVYSMLNDEPYKVYAVDKAMAKKLSLQDKARVPEGEEPAEVFLVMQHVIPYHDGKTVDPLSILLMLSPEEKADPRIEMAVDEMLKEQIWSKD